MNTTPANLTCLTCGRDASGIAKCPKRPQLNCPYALTKRSRYSGLLVLSLILTVIIFLRFDYWWALIWAGLSLTLWAALVETRFFYKQAQTRLRQLTLAGLELSHTWKTCGQLLPVRLALSGPITIPFSIAALAGTASGLQADISQATRIFRSALLGLLATESIEVYRNPGYTISKWHPSPLATDDYIIVATQIGRHNNIAGALERAIMHTLQAWTPQAEACDWQGGPSIYDLVRAVYEQDRVGAPKWLAKLVAEDATLSWRLGKIEGALFWKQIKWDASHTGNLQKDQLALQLLAEQFDRNFLEFSVRLNSEVSKAIASREDNSY